MIDPQTTRTPLVIADLSCSAKNCNLGTCPDCGECVRFCNCVRAVSGR